jgi:hypothetical protein
LPSRGSVKESPGEAGPVSDEELSIGVSEDPGITDDEDCKASEVPEERAVLAEEFAPPLDRGIVASEDWVDSEDPIDSELSGSSGVSAEVESVQAVIAKVSDATRGMDVLNMNFFFMGFSVSQYKKARGTPNRLFPAENSKCS